MALSETSALLSQQAEAQGQEMILNEGRAEVFALTRHGLVSTSNSDLLVLPLADMVGVRRTGSVLTFYSYPLPSKTTSARRGPLSLLCCCLPSMTSNKKRRTRVVDVLDCRSENMAMTWEKDVWDMLLPPAQRRPDSAATTTTHARRFLVFINPHSGTGRADSIFAKTCLPVFEDAGIECTLVRTERAGHAAEYCEQSKDLPTFDGIVVVSGDGMMFECLQGLMKRPDWAQVVRTVALGVIPGGSGNGLAHSLAHAARESGGGTPLNCAFLIAKGRKCPLDVCMIDHASRGRIYSFLSTEYGIACEVDIGSEYLRSLGEVRFTVEALRLLINPHSTRLRFSYLPVTEQNQQQVASYWDVVGGEATSSSGPQSLLPLSEEAAWVTMEDDVYLMWNCNVAWMSSTAHVAPSSHAHDGYQQVCLYRKQPRRQHSARSHIARFFLALDYGAHVDLPFIETFPTRAYVIDPLPSAHRTMVGIDGELVPLERMRFEVLPGLAMLMGVSPGGGGVQQQEYGGA